MEGAQHHGLWDVDFQEQKAGFGFHSGWRLSKRLGTSSMLIAPVRSRPNGSNLLATEMHREATELKKAHILFTSREFGWAGRQTNRCFKQICCSFMDSLSKYCHFALSVKGLFVFYSVSLSHSLFALGAILNREPLSAPFLLLNP